MRFEKGIPINELVFLGMSFVYIFFGIKVFKFNLSYCNSIQDASHVILLST